MTNTQLVAARWSPVWSGTLVSISAETFGFLENNDPAE
jgi:hypothetical protein